MGGISIWQLLIIALIVILLFGTKKLGTIGSDLGNALKGFKKAMGDDSSAEKKTEDHSKDADFAPSTLAEKQTSSPESAKETQKNKEQA